LIDINPWALQTDSLLFSWDELSDFDATGMPVFLLIESQAHVLQSNGPTYSSSRLPKEVVDLSNGESIQEFAQKFQEELLFQ
jgi:hypothetical protein